MNTKKRLRLSGVEVPLVRINGAVPALILFFQIYRLQKLADLLNA